MLLPAQEVQLHSLRTLHRYRLAVSVRHSSVRQREYVCGRTAQARSAAGFGMVPAAGRTARTVPPAREQIAYRLRIAQALGIRVRVPVQAIKTMAVSTAKKRATAETVTEATINGRAS